MSANNDVEEFFLYVGVTKERRLKKLYIGKGRPDDPNFSWWEAEKKQLLGSSDQEIRDWAEKRARALFASPEDLANKSRALGDWDMNKARADMVGPALLFTINPWPQLVPSDTVNSVDGQTEHNVDGSFAECVVRLRPEQAAFRSRVLAQYGTKCALCSMDVVELLQAAHIRNFAIDPTANLPDNGIPLCLNHHGAFDLHLIEVDPETLAVTVKNAMLEKTVDVQSLSGFLRPAAKVYLQHRVADRNREM